VPYSPEERDCAGAYFVILKKLNFTMSGFTGHNFRYNGFHMDDQTPKKETLTSEIKGMLLGAAGLFVLIAMVSFSSDDISFNSYSYSV
jgi:hypothetical protein